MITEITLRLLMMDPLTVLYFSEIWVWNTDTPITILYCNNTKFCAATCVEQYLVAKTHILFHGHFVTQSFCASTPSPSSIVLVPFPCGHLSLSGLYNNGMSESVVATLHFTSLTHRIENEPMLICTLGSCRSADVKQNSSAVKCPIPTGGASPASAACHCCATATKSSAQPSGPLPTNGACYA